jgi:hypothetical protein
MEKYKDYIARTQQDRIQLDTLATLEKILTILENQDKLIQYNDEQIVTQGVVDAIQRKTRKKNGGDK